MAKFSILSKDGSIEKYSGAPQYSGTYLGVPYIEFSSISSPVPINWQVGDYVDYYRTGFRYKLYSLPEPEKHARPGEYGAAFVYRNVKFYEATKELEIALFRDIVPDDNTIHFSTRQDVSFFANVYGVARRIQECINTIFPNKWRIEVFDTDKEDVLALFNETKEFSISSGSCLDALSQIYETWKNVGWTHTYDEAASLDVITIGRTSVRDIQNTTDSFAYGRGNGLKSIKRAAANEGEFATRLYVFGSERNIPNRYYNNFDILNKESVDIRNLMIPISEWGFSDGLPDPKKAYLQADDAIIEKYGLIPRMVYFDGSENEEIYPSIVGLTEAKVREYMVEAGLGESDLLPPYEDTRIDKVRSASFSNDNGSAEDVNKNPDFQLGLNGIGFDLVAEGKKASEGRAVLSMKSGSCAGRDFIVTGNTFSGYQQELTVERTWDESIGMGFPNSLFPINEGDEFVILDIPMPDYYVKIASDRLLEAGKKMLADYTKVSAYYEPEIDSIKIKEGGQLLREGLYMAVYDEDIIDTEGNVDYVLIDTLTIDENGALPSYKVTLREQKRSARTFSALEDMIEDAESVTKKEFDRQDKYIKRRFQAALDTINALQGSIEGFTDGINPVTVHTMDLVLGNENLQYIFTDSRSSLEEIDCPLIYSQATKQMTAYPSAVIHKTLGTTAIVPGGSLTADNYKSWSLPEYHSEVLEDDSNPRYVYIRASQSSTEADFVLSKEAIGMRDEAGWYHLLVGVLSSELEGVREFVTLYGFTEILPGQITTDVIRSSDGQTYFDLVKGEIAGDIKFLASDGTKKKMSDFADEQSAQFSAVDKNVKNLQDQIDGVVENHFYEGTPTTSNYPASSWTTDTQKINHIGDTYTDIEEFVDSATTPNAGKSWRWCRCEDMDKSVFAIDIPSYYVGMWFKIGNIDTNSTYLYYQLKKGGAVVSSGHIFDLSQEYNIGWANATLMLKIDPSTGDVQIKDENGKFVSGYELVLEGSNYDFVEATDKDGEVLKLHWHPIADTDAVKALLKVYELEKRVDDAEYLKTTFAKGETNISGGVVISQMIGVGDGGKDIEAFLNGSGEFLDDTHGKMILAGGIPEGSDDIKERSKEAKTRLYEDGHFETKDGKMELMQVNSMRSMVSQIDGIAYIFNNKPWYIKEFEEYNGKPNSPDDIIIGGSSDAPQKKVIMAGWAMSWTTEPDIAWGIDQIGRRRTFIHHKNSSGFEEAWCTLKTPDYDERPNDTSGLYPPYFYVDGTPRKSLKICANDCIELYGYGYHTKEDRSAGVFMGWIVTNRTPIFGGVNKYHLSGMQEGLRPKMRTITSSETLSELDHSIMVISPTSITIKLPEDPEIGQVIECYMAYLPSAGHSVTFDGNGTGIQDPLDDTWGLSSVDVNPSGVIRLVCAYDQYGTKRWWFYRLR